MNICSPIVLTLAVVLLAATPVRAQIYSLSGQQGLTPVDCAKASSLSPQPNHWCFTSGLTVRCVDRLEAVPREACAAPRSAEPAARRLMETIGTDLRQGRRRAGGRFVTAESCPPGFPEGDVLLPDGVLRLAATEGRASSMAVVDPRSGQLLASAASLQQTGIALDAFRGRSLALTGQLDGVRFRCAFTVLGRDDAGPLIANWNRLPAGDSTAAVIERAAFLRQADLPYEYWLTLGQLK